MKITFGNHCPRFRKDLLPHVKFYKRKAHAIISYLTMGGKKIIFKERLMKYNVAKC
jgi:hypothetical protein